MTTTRSDTLPIVKIRAGSESDHPLIYATWLKGFYYGNNFSDLNKEKFFDAHRQILDCIMMSPKTQIKIACLNEDPDVILGYSVLDGDHTLHFVFIKEIWRKMGIAKQLVPKSVVTTTHLTKVGRMAKPKSWRYDPFLLWDMLLRSKDV